MIVPSSECGCEIRGSAINFEERSIETIDGLLIEWSVERVKTQTRTSWDGMGALLSSL